MDGLGIPLALAVGYLLGSIPFAVWIARAKGVDIFKAGSGNPGATNVKRVLGKGPGNLCFALDCLKGLVAALWPVLVDWGQPLWELCASAHAELCGIAGLVGAILGHSFSVFLRFRGGKGVAVTIGGVGALYTPVIAVGLLVWLGVFYTTRVVALGSVALALSLPLANLALWFVGANSLLLADPGVASHVVMVLLALLVVARHQSNLRRLRRGEEQAFGRER
ncbi:MAG: glycerol-3-phosphate 1-O-acyltransferase PlsY [Opitutales bacterium]